MKSPQKTGISHSKIIKNLVVITKT